MGGATPMIMPGWRAFSKYGKARRCIYGNIKHQPMCPIIGVQAKVSLNQ